MKWHLYPLFNDAQTTLVVVCSDGEHQPDETIAHIALDQRNGGVLITVAPRVRIETGDVEALRHSS
jgi:hypothetical protein